LIEVDEAYFSEALKATRAIQNEDYRADRLSELTKVDGADFSELLEAARAIQNEDYRAKVLIELTKIDRVYFSEALEATRAIQNEYRREDLLSELTKVDGADFSELLEAARAIQNESSRAKVLIELTKIDGVYFSEALEAVRVIQDESSRADLLSKLAQWVPQELFPKVWKAIFEISNKSACALAISDSLPRLPLATVSHSDWSLYLHVLAHRKRSYLMPDLVTLYSAILHLGGDTAMRGVVDSMREICNQWK
jgi:ABC-type transporter Mla MlaB component